MGYTTGFEGRFHTSRPFTVPESNELKELQSTRHGGNTEVHAGMPSFWNQWVPTKDGLGIEWDGGEKFYHYQEWIQYIIDHQLKDWGVTLTGKIRFQGEDTEDMGFVVIEDGVASIEKLSVVGVVKCPSCEHQFVPDAI